MSSNQLNDISKVYLSQIAEETPAERIDRISKANVAKQKEKSDADKAARAKKTADFQKHKASVLAKGGRPVDALDSWHKKQAHEALELRTEKKEVNVKDTYKTVAAIVDYDRAKKGSEYATYDSEHGKKKEAKKERDYAAWERSKMKKDDPNWKHKKYHTGMHGEDKDWGYDKKGNSLNPADIEARKKKQDKLFGAPRVKEEVEVNEGDTYAKQLARFEAGRQKRMKASGSYERPNWIPKDQDHSDKYGSSKGKKVKKESLSDWRTDLSSLIEIVAEPEDKAEKEVVEKKVKNKVIINPKFTEAVEDMGGELLEMVEVTEEYEPQIEAATEYFYAEGINEEGLEAIIEEVGLDTFVDFVIDSAQDLNEERDARKMTARNLQTLKKKTIPAAKKAEALRKKEGKGEYSAAYKKKETDVTVYDDKPKAKKKAAPKKAEPKPVAVKKPAAKKVAAVTKQVKKLQPAKKASKQGLGDKIRGAIKKGVARHQAARAKGREPEKRVKEFGKGFASGVKGAVKFAKDVKKVVSEEELVEKEGQVKKELGYLSKAVKTMKGKNVAKADKVEEDYETKKKSEVMAALKKRTLDSRTKNKIADDIVKKKGDTSKSDDRYAYEGYQRNPEKGEAEERKRSKKVPGERTPMPPRGDKRREDFERWYAANVR